MWKILALLFIRTLAADSYDLVIYGGSSAGVMAAVQGARMGKSVLLISPEKHLGGMTSSGLGWVDVGNPATAGGLAHEYFHRVWRHYQEKGSWVWELPRSISGQLQTPSSDMMWVVEPHVAEKIFDQMIEEAKVPVLRGERVDRQNGVTKEGTRILFLHLESGRSVSGAMFIDASYEGDLMAATHVSYVIQRESNSQYGETLNGIRFNIKHASHLKRVDPFRIPGVPESGLLPRVFSLQGESNGDPDPGIQAYNYRMCLTDVPANRIFITKPIDYDEREYELLFRAIEAGISHQSFFKLDLLPNRKTDSNNNGMISTDYVGMNWDYVEADYKSREKIAKAHEKWQRGLVWTLQNHPRVPSHVKAYYTPWGLARDEFADNNHWPYQLYIREARRMVSAVVVTEQTVLGEDPVPDPIGLSSYEMDSHLVKYIALPEGHLATEGGMFRKVRFPFSISYRAIIPRREECENLLVPVCLSASHAAHGSVRMELVFMMLGSAAATAASLAIDHAVSLQDLPYETLRRKLVEHKQILYWGDIKKLKPR